MMNFLKAAVLSAALVAAGAVTAEAGRGRGRFRRIRRPRGLRRAPALGSQRRPIEQRRIPVRIPRATIRERPSVPAPIAVPAKPASVLSWKLLT